MPEKNLQSPSSRDTLLALIPFMVLIGIIAFVVALKGASEASSAAPAALLAASAVAIATAAVSGKFNFGSLRSGLVSSARQLLPAIPVLACIGFIASTWILGGIVPMMIDYGITMLNADMFLPIACFVCAVISVLLGSSWTTIATVGVAFMGIGTVLGYHEGWIAGAIISGAYFGDKVSPLSDTTVLASSSCGVDLLSHIRNLMHTSLPAMLVALTVFSLVGINHASHPVSHSVEINEQLREIFVFSPWLVVAPVVTVVLCVMRVPSLAVLLVSGFMGLLAVFTLQPEVVARLSDGTLMSVLASVPRIIFGSTDIASGEMLADLVATGGVAGMLPTICLVLSAMIFGGILIGTGALATITGALTARLRRSSSLVASTAATGLMLNSCTGDQYLSIIIGSNLFRSAYRRSGYEPKLLSRTLEDSVSVTSVLIPWNSCGITQSTVLGVSTLVYLPFCIFNWLSPLMSILAACAREHRLPQRALRLLPVLSGKS